MYFNIHSDQAAVEDGPTIHFAHSNLKKEKICILGQPPREDLPDINKISEMAQKCLI